MTDIQSPQNPRVKRAAKLRTTRGRHQQQRILIEGAREVLRATEAKVAIDEVYYDDRSLSNKEAEKAWSQLPDTVERMRITPAVWEKLAVRGKDAQLLAVARAPTLELDSLQLPECPLLLVLEAVEKPGNLGALFRTADAAGVNAVLVVDSVCDVFSPNCIRASLGAVFSTPAARAHSDQALTFLREQNIQVLTARVDGAEDCWDADFRMPIAIVMGNEAQGVSNHWRGESIRAVRLPMQGQVDSLNVSAAAAVLAFEAVRQRRRLPH